MKTLQQFKTQLKDIETKKEEEQSMLKTFKEERDILLQEKAHYFRLIAGIVKDIAAVIHHRHEFEMEHNTAFEIESLDHRQSSLTILS